jgi:1,2-diacylglycerol-3-alpha-glucose alpha-1,2-galactosyltransferase
MRVNVISESEFTVQGHGVHSAFVDTVEALRKYTDCDVAINTSRPADVTHIHSPGPYSLRKLLFDKGVKVVSAHVTPASFVGSLALAKYWRWLATIYLTWFYNKADAVLAVSFEVMDELRAMGVRRPVYLVPNTIATETFRSTPGDRARYRRELGLTESEFVVMGCGQVQPRKRVDVFVEAAKALPELRFVWVGGIPFKGIAADRATMEKVMSTHPINVTFTGLVKREEVERWYGAADLFFLPSMQETFGLVILEAAAAGLPLLLRDLKQYRQTFEGGYAPGNDEVFTTEIKKFSTDKQYYEHWQRAARLIAERYDSKLGAARLMEVYEKALENRVAQTTEARS